jgi:hypothetical protein
MDSQGYGSELQKIKLPKDFILNFVNSWVSPENPNSVKTEAPFPLPFQLRCKLQHLGSKVPRPTAARDPMSCMLKTKACLSTFTLLTYPLTFLPHPLMVYLAKFGPSFKVLTFNPQTIP